MTQRDSTRVFAFHPLADIFPLLEGEAFDELVEDIRQHGVREKVWLYEEKILDGRNRYRAAAIADVECPTRIYEGDDPVAFVVSLNLKRRHLNESQRALVAAKIATLPHGANQWRTGHLAAPPTQEAAAMLLNVGERSVRRAAEVRDHGASELVRAVEQGEVSVAAAADIASLPIERQREIVANIDRRVLLAEAKQVRAERVEARRAERIQQLIEISNNNSPLPTEHKYPIILADPAYRFGWLDGNSNGSAEHHYPTLTVDEICALPVADLATPDAVLFLWAPAMLLPEAMRILAAWGFSYLTNITWVKDKIGCGTWVRHQHEHLIIAKRGNMPTTATKNRPPSVITAPRREHSRKPDEAYEMIEQMYPGLPRMELFARHPRPGWAQWGNELPPMPVLLEAAE